MFDKDILLDDKMKTKAYYDNDGRLIGASGTATPQLSGWQAIQQPQSYADKTKSSMAALEGYTRYTDPYNTNSIRRELDNFSYNPQTDPTYQSYADMYGRQSQAAQGQTMANLTALSGGRNNSWASAATAQVGQAYAQKTSDMIPQLAQQAYEKLLQRYNIQAQESDRAYGRYGDDFNRQQSMANMYNQLGQQDIANQRQQIMDDDYLRNSQLAYNQNNLQYGLDKQYAGQERALNYQNQQYQATLNRQAVDRGEIDLANYPEIIQQQILSGQLSIEQAKLGITLGNKELSWYDKQMQANINATNRSNTGGGSTSKPTQYDKEQGIKSQISQLLYPSNIPSGVSQLYYPIQQLYNNRGTLNSYADKSYIDGLIMAEASKLAKAEGKSHNDVLYEQGFGDLIKY